MEGDVRVRAGSAERRRGRAVARARSERSRFLCRRACARARGSGGRGCGKGCGLSGGCGRLCDLWFGVSVVCLTLCLLCRAGSLRRAGIEGASVGGVWRGQEDREERGEERRQQGETNRHPSHPQLRCAAAPLPRRGWKMYARAVSLRGLGSRFAGG